MNVKIIGNYAMTNRSYDRNRIQVFTNDYKRCFMCKKTYHLHIDLLHAKYVLREHLQTVVVMRFVQLLYLHVHCYCYFYLDTNDYDDKFVCIFCFVCQNCIYVRTFTSRQKNSVFIPNWLLEANRIDVKDWLRLVKY